MTTTTVKERCTKAILEFERHGYRAQLREYARDGFVLEIRPGKGRIVEEPMSHVSEIHGIHPGIKRVRIEEEADGTCTWVVGVENRG